MKRQKTIISDRQHLKMSYPQPKVKTTTSRTEKHHKNNHHCGAFEQTILKVEKKRNFNLKMLHRKTRANSPIRKIREKENKYGSHYWSLPEQLTECRTRRPSPTLRTRKAGIHRKQRAPRNQKLTKRCQSWQWSRNSGHRQPLKTNFPTVNVKSYCIRNSETVYFMQRNRIID